MFIGGVVSMNIIHLRMACCADIPQGIILISLAECNHLSLHKKQKRKKSYYSFVLRRFIRREDENEVETRVKVSERLRQDKARKKLNKYTRIPHTNSISCTVIIYVCTYTLAGLRCIQTGKPSQASIRHLKMSKKNF